MIAPDATLPGLHLEDTEPAQFDALAPHHRGAHRLEHRVHGQLSLDLGDVGQLRNLVHDVDFDHGAVGVCPVSDDK